MTIDSEETLPPFSPLKEVVWKHIQAAILTANGNMSKAARLLGIDRRTLYRHLQRRKDREPHV